MMALAMPASRSLIALLVGTVVFFALWIVALKPHSSNSSGKSSSQGLGAYQSDISKAHHAVATSNASNAASGNENATSSSGGASASQPSPSASKPSATAKPAKTSTSKPAAKATATSTTKAATKATVSTAASHPQSAAISLSAVKHALSAHKALALLFYNPVAADDQAVKQELASVPGHKGKVVKLAIPLSQAAKFTAITQQVPLNVSPTLVLLSPTGKATEIVGYSDSLEIDQRLDDALAAS